ncbi:alcohol dehydrogenase catalytic domain-containing protein [Campylobacter aviculae]|uniref:Galactitol-1-phosphate 5-dehydrogenase n=1 Tax=Campylobacter aviculae TaxID=2510190 RepID=A0A4U7BPI6_9BACT|nr:alcohol dehydrogenase catalytic domain-containing protein [Campylobacter aviculae]TKX32195.1 hypothetical protein CQA76_04710 [Campylobacter aviculae]
MKRIILKSREKLYVDECEIPKLKDLSAIVNVKACGICSSDYSRIYREGFNNFPLVLGHEFSGVIAEVDESQKRIKKNDRVVIFPLKPCFKCFNCKRNMYAQCVKYSYFGSREDGGLQEYISVPIWNILPIYDIPFDIAALIEPAAVALHAIKKSAVKDDDKILIFGTGVIGIFLGLILNTMKINNINYMVRNQNKYEFLHSLGFSVLNHTDIDEFDVVFECVGANESIESSINYLGARSKLVLVGNPISDINIKQVIYWKILRSELNIIGVWNSDYPTDWKEIVDIIKNMDYRVLRSMLIQTSDFKDLIDLIDRKYKNEISKLKVMWIND